MCIEFGKAIKEDYNRINELFIEMLQTIFKSNKMIGYSIKDLDRFFDNRDEWISVAKINNIIVAFLSIEVHHEDIEYIYLDDLSVTKQYRNNGIGTKLISIAENYAKEIGVSTICFHVEKSNEAAFRLYNRIGYSVHEDQGSRYLMIKKVQLN